MGCAAVLGVWAGNKGLGKSTQAFVAGSLFLLEDIFAFVLTRRTVPRCAFGRPRGTTHFVKVPIEELGKSCAHPPVCSYLASSCRERSTTGACVRAPTRSQPYGI